MTLEELPVINNPFFPKRVRQLAKIETSLNKKSQNYYVACRQIKDGQEVIIASTKPDFKDERFMIFAENVINIPFKDIIRYETKTNFP